MPAVKRAHKQVLAVRDSTHRDPIRSGKARGADDRFGVLAYEGVGPSRLAARAEVAVGFAVNAVMVSQVLSEPFDTSGRTGGGCSSKGSQSAARVQTGSP
jgi:hypothetical protein